MYALIISFQCPQWTLGAILITCAWLNLLKYIRLLPFRTSLFVIMFINIAKTMLRLMIIVAIFLIAFGFGFHILFINQVILKLELYKPK